MLQVFLVFIPDRILVRRSDQDVGGPVLEGLEDRGPGPLRTGHDQRALTFQGGSDFDGQSQALVVDFADQEENAAGVFLGQGLFEIAFQGESCQLQSLVGNALLVNCNLGVVFSDD